MISKMFRKLKKKRESFELIEGDFRIWFGLKILNKVSVHINYV